MTGFAPHVLPSGGAELDIIGAGFDAGDTVTISVYGSQSAPNSEPVEQMLGELTADGNGVVVGAFEVDLSPGFYGVRAEATSGQTAQAPLIVK